MGVGYLLVNQTKCERIIFAHLPANTAREIAGQPAVAAVVAWYLLQNKGDQIAFVSDTYGEWPLPGEKPDTTTWPDRTDETVSSLIEAGILRDDGMLYQDEDEPDTAFIRKLTNVWTNMDSTEQVNSADAKGRAAD